MRCSECHAESLRGGQYCTSCGRELVPQEETQATSLETATDQYAFDFSQKPSQLCGSCGGPSPDGELCPSCLQAFSSVLRSSAAAPALAEELALHPFDSTMLVPEPLTANVVTVEPVVEVAPLAPVEVAPVAPVLEAVPLAPVSELAPVAPVLEPALVAAVSEVAAVEPVAAVTAEVEHAPAAEPVKVAAAVQPARRNRVELVAVAAVLVVAVVGVPTGAMWLRNQASARATSERPSEPPAAAPATAAPVARAVAPPAAPVEPEPTPVEVKPTPPPPAPAVAARPAVTARPAAVASARAPRTATSAKAQARPSVQASAPLVASAELTAAPTPLAPQAAPALAPAPQAQVSMGAEAPTGRLFEPTEVDESPRIVTRVQPQLPGGVGRTGSDVVVVRMLVSQSGHPFRVNLLRRSRSGPAVDEAVVAAVKQWTFSPARKRGEAVSCWYNFGVSLAAN